MFNKIKNLIIIVCIIVAGLTAVNFAIAQTPVDPWGGQENAIGNTIGLGSQDPRIIAANVIRVALGFLGIIALGLLIYAGFIWMTAGGNMEKVEQAKKILTNAVIGIVIILASFAIVTFILNQLISATGGGPGSCGGGPACNSATEVCCGGGCVLKVAGNVCCGGTTYQSPPCSGGGNFVVDRFRPLPSPPSVRNPGIRGFFNKNVSIPSATPSNFIAYVDPLFLPTPLAGGVACAQNNECSSDFCDTTGTGLCIGDYVKGTITVSNRIITLSRINDPLIACPAPNTGIACLSSFTDFIIEAKGNSAIGLLSTGSQQLACGGLNPPCTGDFTTGNVVDVTPPTINVSSANQFCVGVINTINANTTDDAGISFVDFFIDGAWLPPTITPAGSPPLTFNAITAWDTTLLAKGPYNISATVADVDTNFTSDNVKVNLVAAHCCNGLFDPIPALPGDLPEIGVDCGGDCKACAGAMCGISDVISCAPGTADPNCDDSICASDFCNCGDYSATPGFCESKGYPPGTIDCCICEDAPIIDWVTPVGGFCLDAANQPTNDPCSTNADCIAANPTYTSCDLTTPNGATGNYVTIGGRFFGASQGTGYVEFDDGTINPTAALASCVSSWQDNQIIVEVPNSLTNPGSPNTIVITVNADSGFSDTSWQDGRGPDLPFISNIIQRPGICSIAPQSQTMNNPITYTGIRLNGVTAKFGNASNPTNALSSTFGGPLTGTAVVPNLTTGKTSTFVTNNSSGVDINSNYLDFTKNPEPKTGPQIISFDPLQGAPGQYVTIYGTGFGATQGASTVDFNGTGADYNFPAECANSVWSDNQVIVKVPVLGTYPDIGLISMDIGTWPTITSNTNFTVDDSLPLAPSLCKISPIMGPAVTTNVTLSGEYFGAPATAKTRFQLDQDQGPGIVITQVGGADTTNTAVPLNAVSGPVQVIQDGNLACANTAVCTAALGNGWTCYNGNCELIGNGINFQVGNCTPGSNECGATPNLCCPSGSFKEFLCADDLVANGGDGSGSITIDDCYYNGGSSVFEWDFTTAISVPPPTCSGYSLLQCTNNIFCPNSPGLCSPYSGGTIVDKGSCSDANCATVGNCTAACTYDSGLNKCVDNTQSCDLDSTASDVRSNSINTYCASYDNAGTFVNVWHMDTNLSCPANWTMIAGNKCVDLTNLPAECNLCNTGFACIDNSGTGVCGINQNICPSGSTCEPPIGDERCETTDSGKCECCCEIAAPLGQDCCIGLICAGECGSDIIDNTNTYGSCTGCTTDEDGNGTIESPNSGGIDEQALSDAKCNCSKTTGKACDTKRGKDTDGDGLPDGICVDAAITGAPCNDSTTCTNCDATDPSCGVGDYCDSSGATCVCKKVVVGIPCDANQCTAVPPFGAPPAGNCDPTTPDFCTNQDPNLYCDPSTCQCAAKGLPSGATCEDLTSNTNPLQCLLNPCNAAYQCFSETITSPATPGDCGNCCCEVGPPGDNCSSIDPALSCQYDINIAGTCYDSNQGSVSAPIPSPDFGICCGCSDDQQCGSPQTTACSTDECCRPRPYVATTSPWNTQTDVCRNTLITVDFNELMDIGSFTGNVIVIGDHGTNLCPAGMQFLAIGERKGIFGRAWEKIKKLIAKIISPIFSNAIALTSNFCAITGTVSGYHNTGAATTTLIFSPNILLATGTPYYVIIKGDSDTSDNINEGVLNYWGVSMDDMGLSWPDLDVSGAYNIGDRIFNGTEYYGYVFKFTTKDDLSPNGGVCLVDHVEVTPNSYLIKTTNDDLNEVDTDFNDISFDTAKDSDKVFKAEAVSVDGQYLAPIVGTYSWTWNWTGWNTAVIDYDSVNPYNTTTPPPTPIDNSQLFEADPAVTDANTTITVTAQEVFPYINSFSDTADVWVFVCDNPWPPEVAGTWAPWSDAANNCSPGLDLAGCDINTNYDIYYCRDAGGPGTYDDLPAIQSGNTVIRGEEIQGKCDQGYYKGINCAINNDCVKPTTGTLVCTAGKCEDELGGTGGDCVSNSDCNNDGFCDHLLKEFYFLREALPSASSGLSVGDISTTTEGVVDISWSSPAPATDGINIYYGTGSGNYNNQIDLGVGTGQPYRLFGLTTGNTYYFAMTSYDINTGTESPYSNEISITLSDTATSSAPVNLLQGMACNGEVDLSWNANTDDTVGYKVFYGTTAGQYGSSYDVGNVTGAKLTGLSGNNYYFAITAYDAAGNESAYSNEVQVTMLYLLFCDNIISRWSFNEGTGITAYDSVGSNDGTLVNNTNFILDAIRGRVVSFDGTGYIDVGDKSNLNFGTNDFTISVWVNIPPTSSNMEIVSKILAAGINEGYEVGIRSSNGVIFGVVSGVGGSYINPTSDGTDLKDGSWHHISVTFDRNGLVTRYVDGIPDGTADDISSEATNSISTTALFEIGRRSDAADFYFNGSMDEVIIFNKALSDAEVKALFDSYP